MKKISELESTIRDLINDPRKQYKLLQNRTSWNQLCSSLDVIGDTELALDSYINKTYPSDEGTKYLLVYGILQCLFVQQDAVKTMAEALGIAYAPDPLLKHIRDIRHKSVGHPTKKEAGGKVSAHFISGVSLRKEGFTLMSASSDSPHPHFANVDIPELISKQRKIHTDILEEIFNKLKGEAEMHKEDFSDKKLVDIFPETLHYYFQKVFEGTHSESKRKDAGMYIKLISDILDTFEKSLKEREILLAYDTIVCDIEETRYPLKELIEFFEEGGACYLNEKSSYIFTFFLRDKFKSLQGIAEEIDKEYSEDN